MLKYRRGSTYWTSELSKMIDVYHEGDLVSYIGVGAEELYGVVSTVDKVCNKINVSWNGGSDKQHAPDELTLILDADPGIRSRFASEIEEHRRNALYHAGRGRKYRKTQKEIESGVLVCPKCKKAMKAKKYTKKAKIYDCEGCGFKVTSDNIVSEGQKEDMGKVQNMSGLIKRRGSIKKKSKVGRSC